MLMVAVPDPVLAASAGAVERPTRAMTEMAKVRGRQPCRRTGELRSGVSTRTIRIRLIVDNVRITLTFPLPIRKNGSPKDPSTDYLFLDQSLIRHPWNHRSQRFARRALRVTRYEASSKVVPLLREDDVPWQECVSEASTCFIAVDGDIRRSFDRG
jgi:hypothetical protein